MQIAFRAVAPLKLVQRFGSYSKYYSYANYEHEDFPRYYRPQDHVEIRQAVVRPKETISVEGHHRHAVGHDGHHHGEHGKAGHDSHHHAVGQSHHHDTHDHHHNEVAIDDPTGLKTADYYEEDHHHHVQTSRPPKEYNTVSTFLDHANLTTYFEVGPGYMKYSGVDYSGHHEAPYDWRLDPAVNLDFTQDSKEFGKAPVSSYKTPFEGRDDLSKLWSPDTSHLYNVNLALKPQNKPVGMIPNGRRVVYWDPIGDVNHEYHYESEDYDFTTQNFRAVQHFRKKAVLWPYVFVTLMPIIYFIGEFLFQHYPDEDHWKLSRPPPLDYPDVEDTNDTETYNAYHSPAGRRLLDMGLIIPLYFDIKDGKKVYRRFAGVNQPMEDI